MSDFNCLGPDAIPSSAEALIPKDLDFVILPGNDSTAPWMVNCCDPNPVNLPGGCYLWCEIPKSQITTNSDGKKGNTMGQCMRMAGKPTNESRIVGAHYGSGTSTLGVKGMCIWAIMIVATAMHLL
ncbi:hypothetical protein B0T16DRAFT_461452 [Cercophora newfieldiana]|uniref:Uncharacterized protein n=1 Tax=Cercophora newfieldiana TaxID=92897 RepID=A0AA39XX25_9PEZI|nr:hypothetical protein B0T16DRAFT_461452 [Cercophora newfieldiana]